MNQKRAGIFLSYLGLIVKNGVLLLYTPLMLSLLDKNEYGVYQLVASVIAYLGIISTGFNSSYVRFFSIKKNQKNKQALAKLNGLFLIIFLLISLLTIILGGVMVANLDVFFGHSFSFGELKLAKILMALMILNLAISFPSSIFDSYIIANERFIFQKVLLLMTSLFSPIVTVPFLFLGYGSLSLVLVTTVFTIITLFANMYYCKKQLAIEFSFSGLDIKEAKEIIFFASYILLNLLVDQVNWNVPKVVLGVFSGPSMIAVYSIGFQISQIFLSFSTAISGVYIPEVNKIVASSGRNKRRERKKLTVLFTKVGTMQILILSYIFGGFLIIGKYFIYIWAGNAYDDSYYVAVLLMFPLLVPLIQNIGLEIQKAKNLHKFRSIVYVIIAIANVVIMIPFSKYYGAIGASIGTLVTMIIGNWLIMNWYYYRVVKLDIFYFWKTMMKYILVAAAAVFLTKIIVFKITINSIKTFILIGLLYSVLFIGLTWKFTIDEDVKEKIGLKLRLRRKNENN